MTDELKPLLSCPFCGGKSKLIESHRFGPEDTTPHYWKVSCNIIGCNGAAVNIWYPSPEAAITAWNRRTEPIGNSDELPIRSEVKTFAEFMEVSLKLNDYKGGWRNKTPDWLMSRLKDEVQDLQAALDFALYNEEKIGECVDVANYAMMIADVLSLRREDAE